MEDRRNEGNLQGGTSWKEVGYGLFIFVYFEFGEGYLWIEFG